MSPEENPLEVLTFIVAPAMLTNAASVLTLGTSNRMARAVDRARLLAARLERKEGTSAATHELLLRQLSYSERRVRVIVRAMTAFYLAVGSFGGATLVSLLGAITFAGQFVAARPFIFGAALFIGAAGVGALMAGATLLVFETRLAERDLSKEMAMRSLERGDERA